MNIQVFPDYKTLSREAAKFVFGEITVRLAHQNHFVLGLPTGATPIGMFHEIISLMRNETNLNLSSLYTFNLDEYYPMLQSDPQSYFQFMKKGFWEELFKVNPTFKYKTQAFILNGASHDPALECKQYEEKIGSLGGLDLAVLGIGTNGHIGFNEPGTLPTSRTRVVDLSSETITVNSQKFFEGNLDKVPKQALTMGLGTINEARKLLLIVSGSSKAAIMNTVLSGPTDPNIPACHILSHPDITIFLDTEAAPQSVLTHATPK